jgi:dihydroceramidase
MGLPSISYRSEPHIPFWGPATSNFNFCETDYLNTPYIAEFINTLTNLIYVFYSLNAISRNVSRSPSTYAGLARSGPWFGILAVGIGSIVFHATMKPYTQWADDLSMLVASGLSTHHVFTFQSSRTKSILAGLGFGGFLTAFSVWHCITDETGMHSLIFGILVLVQTIKVRSIISTRVSSPLVRAQVKRLNIVGAILFLTGYGIWNIDYVACGWLGGVRRQVGMPWGFLTELHGWWHIFTGVGGYINFVTVEYLTGDTVGSSLDGQYVWPIPSILRSVDVGKVEEEERKRKEM